MKSADASLFNLFCKHKDKSSLSNDESEDLGDILDSEVNSYLNSKKEVHYKKIIWEQINKDYLQEQALKKQGFHVARATAVVKKSTKRQRDREAPTSNPAQADSEATREMLTKKVLSFLTLQPGVVQLVKEGLGVFKRLSSKINFDVLEELFSDVPASGSNKKQEASSCEENVDEEDPIDSNVAFEEDVDTEHEDPTVNYGNEYYDFENGEEYGYEYGDYGADEEY